MVPSPREDTDNADICDMLGRLLAIGTTDVGGGVDPRGAPTRATNDGAPGDGPDEATIAAFGLDHAHHPARLPQLLRELSSPRAA